MKSEKDRSVAEAHLRVAEADRALAERERARGEALLALSALLEQEAESALDQRVAGVLKHQSEIARSRAETSGKKVTTHEEEAKSEQAAAQLAEQRARVAPPDEEGPHTGARH